MDFTVRQAQEEDYEAVRALLTAEYRHNGYTDDDLHNLEGTIYDPGNTARKVVDASRDPDAVTRCWLAFAGDRAVGIVTTKDSSGGVYVEEDYRKQGIATALVAARTAFLQQHGHQQAEAHIESSNMGSIRTFRNLGYEFNAESRKLVEEAAERGISLENMKDPHTGRPPVLVLTRNL